MAKAFRRNTFSLSRYSVAALVAFGLTVNGCSYNNHNNGEDSPAVIVGRIADSAIKEASGLARSNRRDDLLWVINDGGSAPILHAIGLDGRSFARVRVRNSENVDWEDLASFELDGKSWLIVADIGDNEGKRALCTLYFVEEPIIDGDKTISVAPAWQISFTYPGGPLDAEAIAVDTENERVLLLSKRTIPAILYELPLRSGATNLPKTARRIGPVASIPQPTQQDIDRAVPDKNWHWQPTAMDISKRGDSLVILTYRAAYTYSRAADQRWIGALQSTPRRFAIGKHRVAESIAYSTNSDSLFITIEQRHAPLLRFSLE